MSPVIRDIGGWFADMVFKIVDVAPNVSQFCLSRYILDLLLGPLRQFIFKVSSKLVWWIRHNKVWMKYIVLVNMNVL